MKYELNRPWRQYYWTALQVLFLSAALSCPARAGDQSCNDIFTAIKNAARYCGFFCDQGELIPLQRAYERRCLISSLSPSDLGFDSSPEPPPHIDRNTLLISPH
jgi:hypothetical protein